MKKTSIRKFVLMMTATLLILATLSGCAREHAFSDVYDDNQSVCSESKEAPSPAEGSEQDIRSEEHGETTDVSSLSESAEQDTTYKEHGETTERHDHIYISVCDATCEECGAAREVPDHVYSSDCDATCEECGAAREISDHVYDSDSKCADLTCIVCGYVNKQEHDYARIHYTAPTLLEIGHEKVKCATCQQEVSRTLTKLKPEDLGMPAVYLTEFPDAQIELIDLEKSDGEIPIYFEYRSNSANIDSFVGTAKIKVQGASSTQFEKKNLSVKLYQDDTFTKDKKLKVDLGWGKENKYCLKANYMDFSHARNIISANLFTKLVASRETPNENLLNAPNYGVIDGFPILVYVNGEFHGLYTMNIPKDKWMFAMEGDETAKEAILMAEDWTKYTALRKKIGSGAFEDYGWELEYASTEDTDTAWVKDSFNQLITLLNCGDNVKIKKELHKHLDIEAAIDNMLFTFFIDGVDLTSKNILWATYDGQIWIPSMYDMDMTYGISWDGSPIKKHLLPALNENGTLQLWDDPAMYVALLACFPEEVEARWSYLRKNILTLKNVKAHFDAFYAKVPMEAYDADRAKWLDVDSWPYTFSYEHHTNYYEVTMEQIRYLDTFFYDLNK